MATKQETKNIAIALKKKVQLLNIKRDEKIEIYLGLVEGLAQSTFFNDEDLKDIDKLLNEAIAVFNRKVRQAPKTIQPAVNLGDRLHSLQNINIGSNLFE